MEFQHFNIWDDLKKFNNLKFEERMNSFYQKLPTTKCDECIRCCYDSPVITYIEFLYIFQYLIRTYKEESFWQDLLTKVFKRYIKSLISREQCSFVDQSTNKCIIYEVAPLSCKRWGLQSDEAYNNDSTNSHIFNEQFNEFYESKGIVMPEEMKTIKTDYCNQVKVINNSYNITGGDMEKEMIELFRQSINIFPAGTKSNYNVCDYLANSLHKEQRLFFDRIRTIKKLQSGQEDAINNYINSLNIHVKVKEIISSS